MSAGRRMLNLAARVIALALVAGMWSIRSVAAQTEVVEYYAQDALGSIRIVFNASGAAIARADYEPFGELFAVPGMPGTSGLPATQFTGQERDAEASLDYFGARFLAPRTGRFSQVDPVYAGLFDPQQWNRYAYARNNPVSFVDPSGALVEAPDRPAWMCAAEFKWCGPSLWDLGNGGDPSWGGWGWGPKPPPKPPIVTPESTCGGDGQDPCPPSTTTPTTTCGGPGMPPCPPLPCGGPGNPCPVVAPTAAVQATAAKTLDGDGAPGCFSKNFTFALGATNRFFFSGITRLARTGVGLITSGGVARQTGLTSIGMAWRELAAGEGVANLGFRGTLVSVGANAAVNAALSGLALEGGILAGSAIDASIQTYWAGNCQ